MLCLAIPGKRLTSEGRIILRIHGRVNVKEPGRVASSSDFPSAARVLGSSIHRLRRRADRFEPPADVDLRVRLSAEMASARALSGREIPAEDRQFFFSALDDEPVNRIVADDPANFAAELFERGHAAVDLVDEPNTAQRSRCRHKQQRLALQPARLYKTDSSVSGLALSPKVRLT